MSERPTDPSADWRRQRRRDRGSRRTPSPEARVGQAASAESEEQIVRSRTLFSFMEPALNAIGGFGTPIVIAGVVGLFLGITLILFVSSMRLYGVITLVVGALLVGLVGLIFLSSVFAAFIGRTGRYGINSIIMLAAFLGIVIIINFISFGNPGRFDTTATNQFSIASSSRNLLKDLDQPVRATAFFIDNIPAGLNEQVRLEIMLRRIKVEEKLREFQTRSRNFTYQIKDMDIEPEIARSYGVTQPETIVVENLESKITDLILPTDRIYSELEQDLYTSILVTTGQGQKKVYFLGGHGERRIGGRGGDGYSAIAQGLEGDNYQVETLNWSPTETEVTVPDDAGLLVIAGPTGELPEAHAVALHRYLLGKNADGTDRREGGRMIFLAEPDTSQSFREFLLGWGVIVDPGYIRDVESSVPGNPHTLLLNRYVPDVRIQDITYPRGTPLDVAFMPGAASLRILPEENPLRLPTILAISSAESYLISDIDRTEPLTTAGDLNDPKGVFSPALYVQAVRPMGAPALSGPPSGNELSGLVVFGDADFIANSFVNRGGGSALFLNSANFLLGDISLVSIRDRAFVRREINLDQNQYDFVRFSSWFFLPGLMGLMAALVWWVRR